MANSAYASGINLDALMVPVKAATIYTAQEQSLFLGGQLIPVINVPAGSASAQVPVLGSVTATKLTAEAAPGVDLDSVLPADTKNTIAVDIHAARAVLRDLGGIDPNELGRVLGNAVAASFDQDVITAMDGLTAKSAPTDIGAVDLDDIFEVVGQIRAAGEMTQLYGVISPTAATELLKSIGDAAYAGGDFQTEALRNGFLGTIAGVRMFMSQHAESATKMGYVFGQDALRIAMQKNVDIEVQRRAAAVGFDVVASLHAGVGVVDATRGVTMVDAA
jgi:hypothetical protein